MVINKGDKKQDGQEYMTLDNPVIVQIEAEILSHVETIGNSFLEIGRLLTEAKKLLAHGEWLNWLSNNVKSSVTTAERLMRVFEEYSNSAALNNIGFTKAFILTVIDFEIREDFIGKIHEVNGEQKTVSDMTTRELQEVVREHRQETQPPIEDEPLVKNVPPIENLPNIDWSVEKLPIIKDKVSIIPLALLRIKEDYYSEIDF